MMDHHCLMLGTCIGLQNFKGYLQTLASIKLLSLNIVVAKLAGLWRGRGCKEKDQLLLIASGGILVASLLLLRDQMVGLRFNQTTVESFKYESGDRLSLI